jgi:hypothetical protein
MKNVEIKKEGNKLTVTIDLSKNFGPSGSGKSIIIGSTEGNAEIEKGAGGGVYLGVNCYRKNG